jgi:hypothetical protein
MDDETTIYGIVEDSAIATGHHYKSSNGWTKVCPACVNHGQQDCSKVFDCKNTVTKNGVEIQCQCYHVAHGKRC